MKLLVLLLSVVVVLLLAQPCRPDGVDFGSSLTPSPANPSQVIYRWEQFADGDTTQVKCMDGQRQVGVWMFDEGKYYRIDGVGKWQEEKPPIAPPTRQHRHMAIPTYQPVFYGGGVFCSPRGG